MFGMIKTKVVSHLVGVQKAKLAERALMDIVGILHVVVVT
jgi:hypothetical protein